MIPQTQQARLGFADGDPERDEPLFYAGDLTLVQRPCVAVVGSRKVSQAGAARSARLARELCAAGVVVVSGLAEGVDRAAHMAAIESGGRTIAVIGTPLSKAYPASHAMLQRRIYEEHLLLSPFPDGARVFPGNFPQRNKLMAAISDATVIVEASDTSGTLHQAAECMRLGRWLFIAKSVVDDSAIKWPAKFLKYSTVRVLGQTPDVLEAIAR